MGGARVRGRGRGAWTWSWTRAAHGLTCCLRLSRVGTVTGQRVAAGDRGTRGRSALFDPPCPVSGSGTVYGRSRKRNAVACYAGSGFQGRSKRYTRARTSAHGCQSRSGSRSRVKGERTYREHCPDPARQARAKGVARRVGNRVCRMTLCALTGIQLSFKIHS